MYVSLVYYIILLNMIRDKSPCSLKQLKDAYVHEQLGVIMGRECSFGSHLKHLKMGAVFLLMMELYLS